MSEQHAKAIALKLVDNKWWEEISAIDKKARFGPQSTERELLLKRLQYWMVNMEGDMSSEAPMYSVILAKNVMNIIDRAISNGQSKI